MCGTSGRSIGLEEMANKIKKTEGGQGGLRGHSNMTHWEKTETIKLQARKARRAQGVFAVRAGLQFDTASASGTSDAGDGN